MIPTRALLVAAFVACVYACGGAVESADTPVGVTTASDGAQFDYVASLSGGAFVRGGNSFVVRARTTSGAPATVTHVTAQMPAHGHATYARQIIDQGDGSFEVQGLDLLMPGAWQIQLVLSRTGATDDDRATLTADLP